MLLQEQLSNKINFSDVECTIADYILKRGTDLKYDSARYIAKKIFVSPASIVRLTQKLGFDGYNEFREEWMDEQMYISREIQSVDPNRPFSDNDTLLGIANKMSLLHRETIDDSLGLLEPDMLERAVYFCANAETIYICTVGAQSGLSEAFREKMAKIGKIVIIEGRTDMMYFYAENAQKTDCFIFISYSGETKQLIKVVQKVRSRKLRSIAITSYGANSLTEFIDCILRISSREKLIDNAGNFTVYISTLYLLDVLYACVFKMDYASNLNKRRKTAREFETFRHSDNPMLRDV